MDGLSIFIVLFIVAFGIAVSVVLWRAVKDVHKHDQQALNNKEDS